MSCYGINLEKIHKVRTINTVTGSTGVTLGSIGIILLILAIIITFYIIKYTLDKVANNEETFITRYINAKRTHTRVIEVQEQPLMADEQEMTARSPDLAGTRTQGQDKVTLPPSPTQRSKVNLEVYPQMLTPKAYRPPIVN